MGLSHSVQICCIQVAMVVLRKLFTKSKGTALAYFLVQFLLPLSLSLCLSFLLFQQSVLVRDLQVELSDQPLIIRHLHVQQSALLGILNKKKKNCTEA